MNPKQTWSLVLIALALFLGIYLFEKEDEQAAGLLLPKFNPRDLKALDIQLTTNSTRISLVRSNDNWFLQEPLYPAQSTPINQFLEFLAGARAYEKISTNEVFLEGLPAFGLQPPLARLQLQTVTTTLDLLIGKRTILTNQLYVKVGKDESVLITHSGILDALPSNPHLLRHRSLLHLSRENFDALQLRSGQRIVELRRNPTNSQWQITRPIPARADQLRVRLILDQLEQSQAVSFVTDSPAGELEKFGLQNPALELLLLRGTNAVGQLAFGHALSNQPALIFARLPIFSNVVTAPSSLAAILNQPYKSFHDARLIEFPLTNLSRIDIHAIEQFSLLKDTSNRWTFAPPFQAPLDAELFDRFMTNISSLEIKDIARELPTEADLKAFGFQKPVAAYSLYSARTNEAGSLTNVLLTRIEYGSNQTATILLRRTDEVPIYLGSLAELYSLPRLPFQLRDRQLWSWQGTNIQALVVSHAGRTNMLKRAPSGDWNPDPVLNAVIDETIHRLATARALEWISKGAQRFGAFGLAAPSLVVILEDQHGTQGQIVFGNYTMKKDVYAATTLPDANETLIFEFPGFLYQDLLRNLAPPPN